MTDVEWNSFSSRLFIEYPSLFDRLKRSCGNTLDQTLSHWRKKLSRFTASELYAVLDRWEADNTVPWDAWAIEQAPAVLANVASNMRSVQSERDKVNAMLDDPRSKHRKQSNSEGLSFSILTGNMRDVYLVMRPLYKQLMDGEITQDEYHIIHEREFAKL